MRSTAIRELKHSTSEVLAWVAQGETVDVGRRNEPVALLTPPAGKRTSERPDFAARLRKIYGDYALPSTGTSVVSEARGER